jgi:hypothetical protein
VSLLKKNPLKDRIELLREEIDKRIDELVALEKPNCPGVPELVLRNIMTSRSNGCQCRAYLDLTKEDDHGG